MTSQISTEDLYYPEPPLEVNKLNSIMLTSIYKVRNDIHLPKEMSEIVLLNDIIGENVCPMDFIFNINRDIIK